MIDFVIKIGRLWFTLIRKLNEIIVSVLLVIVFFFIITPHALCRNFVYRKKIFNNGLRKREHIYSFEDLKKMW